MVFLNVRKTDPTGTLGIRSNYVKDVRRRFRAFKAKLRGYILALPVGEKSSASHTFSVNFDFTSNPEKLTAFLAWLKEAEEDGILETVQGPALYGLKLESEQWADKYILSSYKKGARDAYIRAGMAAVTGLTADQYIASAFFSPIHADAVAMLYMRNFTELKGVTAAMDQKISRILAEGLSRGDSPRKIARELGPVVDWGKVRAERVARTECIRAHAEATLNSYASFGIEGVEVLAEILTAGDDRVCEKCSSLEGQVYTIEEARGLIPQHPNCRCVYLPVLG